MDTCESMREGIVRNVCAVLAEDFPKQSIWKKTPSPDVSAVHLQEVVYRHNIQHTDGISMTTTRIRFGAYLMMTRR